MQLIGEDFSALIFFSLLFGFCGFFDLLKVYYYVNFLNGGKIAEKKVMAEKWKKFRIPL